jgi:hypothetical protein
MKNWGQGAPSRGNSMTDIKQNLIHSGWKGWGMGGETRCQQEKSSKASALKFLDGVGQRRNENVKRIPREQ